MGGRSPRPCRERAERGTGNHGNPGAGVQARARERSPGRARRHYLLRGAPLRLRQVRPDPGPRGAESGSRAAGRVPQAPRPNRGSRWSGRSRWSVAWSVPRRGPGPEPPGPPGPLTGAAVAAARSSRTPPPPPSCSEVPGGPRDDAARDPGSGCPKCA